MPPRHIMASCLRCCFLHNFPLFFCLLSLSLPCATLNLLLAGLSLLLLSFLSLMSLFLIICCHCRCSALYWPHHIMATCPPPRICCWPGYIQPQTDFHNGPFYACLPTCLNIAPQHPTFYILTFLASQCSRTQSGSWKKFLKEEMFLVLLFFFLGWI